MERAVARRARCSDSRTFGVRGRPACASILLGLPAVACMRTPNKKTSSVTRGTCAPPAQVTRWIPATMQKVQHGAEILRGCPSRESSVDVIFTSVGRRAAIVLPPTTSGGWSRRRL